MGEELVNLVTASTIWFKVDAAELPQLAAACLDSYIAGLEDAGWRGSPQLAEIGFVIASALRYGPLVAAQAQKRYKLFAEVAGKPVDEWLDCWAAVRRFSFDRLDRARDTLDAL